MSSPEDETNPELAQDYDEPVSFDVNLGIVSGDDSSFRFNSEGKYLPRESNVLVSCTLKDVAHGTVSETDSSLCTLVVFDFQMDRLKKSRSIHRANITVILHGVTVLGIAPENKISFNPQSQKVTRTTSGEAGIGVSQFASLDARARSEVSTEMDSTEYASAKGWTAHFPRPRHNDPSPHNCVKWSVMENPIKKDGVPPHFRAAVLFKRADDEPFQLEMEIDSKADFLTQMEDAVGLHGKAPKGQLTINPADLSTNRLKKYSTKKLGKENLSKISKLSLGTLEEKLFSG